MYTLIRRNPLVEASAYCVSGLDSRLNVICISREPLHQMASEFEFKLRLCPLPIPSHACSMCSKLKYSQKGDIGSINTIDSNGVSKLTAQSGSLRDKYHKL